MPRLASDDSTKTLLGPGVNAMTAPKTTKAIRSGCDMRYSRDLGQDLRPLRDQHDRYPAHHDHHPGKPQRPEALAKHDARSRGADERHQQRERYHLRCRIIPEQTPP